MELSQEVEQLLLIYDKEDSPGNAGEDQNNGGRCVHARKNALSTAGIFFANQLNDDFAQRPDA
eukprot:5618932-Amphidinium_carterae.1